MKQGCIPQDQHFTLKKICHDQRSLSLLWSFCIKGKFSWKFSPTNHWLIRFGNRGGGGGSTRNTLFNVSNKWTRCDLPTQRNLKNPHYYKKVRSILRKSVFQEYVVLLGISCTALCSFCYWIWIGKTMRCLSLVPQHPVEFHVTKTSIWRENLMVTFVTCIKCFISSTRVCIILQWA